MNLTKAAVATVLDGDVDDIAQWAKQLEDDQRPRAYTLAKEVAFAPQQAIILRIKALSLLQSIYSPSSTPPEMAEQSVDSLEQEIQATHHAEFQYLCGRVLATILANGPSVDDVLFDRGSELVKSLSGTAVFPHAREFFASVLSPTGALGRRRLERLRAKRLPVWAFLGKLGTPHKKISREYARRYDAEWVSFGEFIAAEAKRLGLPTTTKELQRLGQELVDQDPEDLCRRVLATADYWSPGLPIVIDGVRHAKVLAALRRLVAPCDVVAFRVEVEPEAMWELLRQKFASDDEAESAKRDRTEEEVDELWPSAAVAAHVGKGNQVLMSAGAA